MKIAILGATGGTGQKLVELALDAGHDVTAVARRAADVSTTHASLRVIEAQATVEADMERALAGAEAVLSGVGSRTRKKNTVRSDTVRAVVAAMQTLGIPRLVWLSASGVGDSVDQARKSSFVFGRIIMPLLLKDVYADAAIADALVAESGLAWTVVRPVGLDDKGPRPAEVIPHDRKIPRSYISRTSVAAFMLAQLASDAYVGAMPIIC